MKMRLFSAVLLVLMLAFGAQCAFADTFVFVGSYHVGAGPQWSIGSPLAVSAQQEAANKFGGNASDYAISTNSSLDPNTITFTGYYDGFGVHPAGGSVFAEDFVESCAGGFYAINNGQFCGQTYSAYIHDAYPANGDPVNYVWLDIQTPEPGSLALLGSGLLGLGGAIRRKLIAR